MEQGFLLICLGFLFAKLLVGIFPAIPSAVGFLLMIIGIRRVKCREGRAGRQKRAALAAYIVTGVALAGYIMSFLQGDQSLVLPHIWDVATDVLVILLLRQTFLWGVDLMYDLGLADRAARYARYSWFYTVLYLLTLICQVVPAINNASQGINLFGVLQGTLDLWMIYLLYRLPGYLATGEGWIAGGGPAGAGTEVESEAGAESKVAAEAGAEEYGEQAEAVAAASTGQPKKRGEALGEEEDAGD